jgi:hypothetical protein
MLKWTQKNGLLVIALFAYVAMTAMLVAQARIIDSQRDLIRLLYTDSQELNARKVHEIQVKRGKGNLEPPKVILAQPN